MMAILAEGEQFEIRPSDISTEGHLWDAFGHYETEVSARYIVKMCQQRGSWEPFTVADIEEVYQAAGFKGFTFNRLIHAGVAYYSTGRRMEGGDWIVEGDDGKLYITDEFVRRVGRSALAQARALSGEGGAP